MEADSDSSRLDNMTERLLSAFEELDFVHTLAERLAGRGETHAFQEDLLKETASILNADAGWIVPKNPGTKVNTALGIPAETAESITALALRDKLAGNNAAWLTDDLLREPQLRRLRALSAIPRALVAAPLTIQGESSGALCFVRMEAGNPFTSRDRRLLATLAYQAALFIKNAELVDSLKREADDLGRRLERLESGPETPSLTWIRGHSEVMERFSQQVQSAASTEATLLLLGESGTGKSLVARIIHNEGVRAGGSMVELNCGAVPAELIESELFGHTKGAFTGADRARAGLFEEAEGGTIFLDEIADLPLRSQVKLLTVLERRTVRRVGENTDRPVNARVIAATNADLQEAVKAGKFREDLYYRLNVINLTLPPLRQRGEDILPLARRFLARLSEETNRRVTGFSVPAQRTLVAYAWPGNVRELRNVVERSLLLKPDGDTIEAKDLPQYLRTAAVDAEPILEATGLPLSKAVQDYERRIILEALRGTGGVVSRAAAVLKTSRTNLHNKIKKHGLGREAVWKTEKEET